MDPRLCAGTSALALAASGGGGSVQRPPAACRARRGPARSHHRRRHPRQRRRTPAPTPAAGAMNLQIAGLAAGMEAVVTVAGGGMTQFATASRMIPNLAPGAYSVTAEPVLTGQSAMAQRPRRRRSRSPPERTCRPPRSTTRHSAAFAIRLLEMPWAGLDQPIFLASPPGDTTRIFVAERPAASASCRTARCSRRRSSTSRRAWRRRASAGHARRSRSTRSTRRTAGCPVHFNNLAGDVVVERFTVSAETRTSPTRRGRRGDRGSRTRRSPTTTAACSRSARTACSTWGWATAAPAGDPFGNTGRTCARLARQACCGST